MQRRNTVRAVAAFAALLLGQLATAEQPPPSRGEVLLFASAEGFKLDGSDTLDDSPDGVLTADVLASWTAGRFRVMGELFLTTEEQDLERLQFGWEIVPETQLWLGRFHQPGSFWNTRQHHGQYLQTSVTRPAIENWEDDSGVLPQHVEGALLESRLSLSQSRGLMISASAGIGPMFRDGLLEPNEVFDPRSDHRGASYGLQVAFLPDYSDNDGIGLVASHSEVMFGDSVRPYGAAHIDLDVAGIFFDFARGPWRATSTTYWIRSAFVETSGGPDDSFVSGYFQLQRRIGERFTVLGRVEASSGADRSAYVALFDDFVEQRNVVDLRWDFAKLHALTIELADTNTLHDGYREYRLQWSAALR